MKLLNKYIVKIPKNVKIIYVENKNILIFIGSKDTKCLKIKLKVVIIINKSLLYVKPPVNFSFLKNKNSLRKTTVVLLKQKLLEVSTVFYKKLKLIGVGYKIFVTKNFMGSLLECRLGFSHSVFFNVTKKTKILSVKNTSFYVFGNSFEKLNQITACIRSCKLPEPYKGKGILYENEKIKLKPGKKI